MFSRCLQDFSRMFSGCSDGSCGPCGFRWSFQMKVWTLLTRRNSMISNYSMIPAIRWSPAIQWSIRCMNFDNRKVYGDTSITDGLVRSEKSQRGVRGGQEKVKIAWNRLNRFEKNRRFTSLIWTSVFARWFQNVQIAEELTKSTGLVSRYNFWTVFFQSFRHVWIPRFIKVFGF